MCKSDKLYRLPIGIIVGDMCLSTFCLCTRNVSSIFTEFLLSYRMYQYTRETELLDSS